MMSSPSWSDLGPALAIGAGLYHAASRLAYVGYAAVCLRRQSRKRTSDRNLGERGRAFDRFRRRISALMVNDAFSLVVLAAVTAGTLQVALPREVLLGIAAGLLILGIGVKAWAARTLGDGAYYFRDFFLPPDAPRANLGGPYRFLKDPMYTVGYAHAYGAALLLLSWPALLAALFDQALILLFSARVERLHVRSLYGPTMP